MKWYVVLFFPLIFWSQELTLLNQQHRDVSFRALSVVDSSVIWVGGSKGMIGRSINGGKTFQWLPQKKYLNNEFRDIQGFHRDSCIAMAITKKAAILETTNGGKSFKQRFTAKEKNAFFDSFDCMNFNECLLVGDAVQPNEMYMLLKQNGKWQRQNNSFNTRNGEVFFAASGTNIQIMEDYNFVAATGGSVSRLLYYFKDVAFHQELEIRQGRENQGANSIHYDQVNNNGIIVGGDFTEVEESMFNCVLFHWDEKLQNFQFELPVSPPKGYKSCVTQLSEKLWVCCGNSGIDYSLDRGKNWIHYKNDPYYSIQKRTENSAILVGPQGKIALLQF